MLAYQLALKAKVKMAEAKLECFNHRYHTFLSKRFDRNIKGERIHFASAMTLLQRNDGDDASLGANYLEMAEFIMQHGAMPTDDLQQLWRRIVFYICISNTDDHLRNHGFIYEPAQGWCLSPAYDINPVATGDGLNLNISETDNSQDLDLARQVAPYFQVKPEAAEVIITEVTDAVRQWQQVADTLKIPRNEQQAMSHAFRVGSI